MAGDQGGNAEPRTLASGGPTRLPAFAGKAPQAPQAPQFPLGSQNVHGSDGPSADGTGDGQVTVPPAGQEQRLPIFDSLESDWFRRSGKTLSTTQWAQGAQAAQPAGQDSWKTSPADEGWRAAQVVASPAAGESTQAGLPRRVPRANLVPGSVGGGGAQGSHEAEAEAPARSPDAARTRMASLQRGVREGRAAAPQIEEP